MSHTRVPQWLPSFREAVRLAWKPLAAYGLFTVSAFVVFMLAVLIDDRYDPDKKLMFVACLAGVVGVFVGQGIALCRLKTLPAFLVCGALVAASLGLLAMREVRDEGGVLGAVVPSAAFFFMGVPCGILSLQHRYELLAAFWPAVGWIGAVLTVLEEHTRLNNWDQDKVTVWTPATIGILSGFILTLMLYLAAKQTMRVELWQALSGATERRISKRTTLAAVPRKNFLPLIVLGLLLTAVVAVLAPYLWRTGPGKHGGGEGDQTPTDGPPKPGSRLDGDALARTLEQMAQASLGALRHLWPLLLLLLVYRPLKRALLLRHLRKPLVPTPPSERVENLWEYVRIAAEDTGVATAPADSVEELVARVRERHPVSEALDRAAEVYARTRYGFVLEAGAVGAMQTAAEAAVKELRATTGFGKKVQNAWRALS